MTLWGPEAVAFMGLGQASVLPTAGALLAPPQFSL